MSPLSTRYQRLSTAYIDLADQFQQLDVEHMTLRSKVAPLVKALQGYKALVEQLKQENRQLAENQAELAETNHELTLKQSALMQRVASLSDRVNQLGALEGLLETNCQTLLDEAEQQMALVTETIEEREAEPDPDLSAADRALLESYAITTDLDAEAAVVALQSAAVA